jgi:hypothetical protein
MKRIGCEPARPVRPHTGVVRYDVSRLLRKEIAQGGETK